MANSGDNAAISLSREIHWPASSDAIASDPPSTAAVDGERSADVISFPGHSVTGSCARQNTGGAYRSSHQGQV
jgi:hypothetical protein